MFLIALGYCISRRNRPFIILGYLFPFSVLLNSIVKGIIQIPRPDMSLHIVKSYSPYGFPSGDALLSTVFWLTLFLSWTKSPARFLAFIPIIVTSLSRVYLGAYSIYDVLGGFVLGLLVVRLFHAPRVQNWISDSRKNYWLLTGSTILAYTLVYRDSSLDVFFFGFIGLMIGYGISMPWIKERDVTSWPKYTTETYMNLIIAGIILYSVVMYTNLSAVSTVPAVNYTLVTLKYILASCFIFVIVPKFMKTSEASK